MQQYSPSTTLQGFCDGEVWGKLLNIFMIHENCTIGRALSDLEVRWRVAMLSRSGNACKRICNGVVGAYMCVGRLPPW